MSSGWLDPVRALLGAAPAPVAVFCRDDDAGWGDDRLVALLDVFAAAGLPVDLAVIPAAMSPGLGGLLAGRVGAGAGAVSVHQHGYAHANHEPAGRRKCEFGAARPVDRQRADLLDGRARLLACFGERLAPVFTPPWNRCTPETGALLVDLGVSVLSRHASDGRLDVPGLAELPVTVDWAKRPPRPEEAGGWLAARLTAPGPVGLMFHHAVMDDDDRRQAAQLLALLAASPAVRARPMLALAV